MEAIKNLLKYICSIMIIILSYYIGNNIETEGFYNIFRPAITLENIEEDKYGSIGLQASEEIPVIESIDQLYDYDYFTVKPVSVVPLPLYRLKSDLINTKSNYYRNRRYRNIKYEEETSSPLFYVKFAYNRYYLLELQDGYYIAACLEDYYAKKVMSGKEITFPVAELSSMATEQRKVVEEQLVNYDKIETYYYLNMFNEDKFEEIDLLDILIRIAIGFITLILLLFLIGTIKDKILSGKIEEEY